MQIKNLQLSHFRNHAAFSLTVKKPIITIIGKNTSGKTNILESLNILTHGKSKKCETEHDLIQKNHDHASISAEIQNQDHFQLQVIYYANPQTGFLQKKYLKNNLAKTQMDFCGNFLSVSFFPEDLRIVSDSPGIRRNFLNQCLVQTDAKYKKALSIYERAIRSRNAILEKIKNKFGRREELEYWDKIAIENGNYLTKKREEFVNFIGRVTNPPLQINVVYDRSEISFTRLAKYADAEIAATSTLVGPHRDDLIFMDGERNLKTFGSRGEQRLLLLLLKLKELEFIEEKTKEKPVLLLDDILSELDDANRAHAMGLIDGRQTIITTADEKEIENLKLDDCQKIYLK